MEVNPRRRKEGRAIFLDNNEGLLYMQIHCFPRRTINFSGEPRGRRIQNGEISGRVYTL
jgi:hypothetical protein